MASSQENKIGWTLWVRGMTYSLSPVNDSEISQSLVSVYEEQSR